MPAATAEPGSAQPSNAEIEQMLSAMLGPVGEPVTTMVEMGAVRRMALAIDNLDPIHFEEEAALARGYRGVVAPWSLLWLYFFTCTEYEHDFEFGVVTVHGQDDYDFHEPIVVGDRITVSTAIIEARLKHGRSGRMGNIVSECRYVNQNGSLCAVVRTTVIRR
jgi:acyl dehydratase